MIKNGQMCVSVDHCFVPRAEVETFVAIAKGFMAQAAPNYAQSEACTGIISQRHMERVRALLGEAERRQARVVKLDEGAASATDKRQVPIALVVDPPADLRIMQEEIFGPIIPVIPYDDTESVIERINASDRPLGVYVFGEDVATIDHILSETTSGGAAVNAAAIQAGLKALGFGGVGMSGMGRHHGEDGFREFSNQRGVVVRGEGASFDALVASARNPAELVGETPSG